MSLTSHDRDSAPVLQLFAENWKTYVLSIYSLFALILLFMARYLWTAYGSSLRKIPGPFPAKFTRLYLFRQSMKGNAHTLYLDLHREYGKIVRIGPNKVSISDPEMIPLIYGITSKYNKV